MTIQIKCPNCCYCFDISSLIKQFQILDETGQNVKKEVQTWQLVPEEQENLEEKQEILEVKQEILEEKQENLEENQDIDQNDPLQISFKEELKSEEFDDEYSGECEFLEIIPRKAFIKHLDINRVEGEKWVNLI